MMTDENSERQIGTIGNYYGGLSIRIENGQPQWGVEDYDGTRWEPITKDLYDALLKFEDERK